MQYGKIIVGSIEIPSADIKYFLSETIYDLVEDDITAREPDWEDILDQTATPVAFVDDDSEGYLRLEYTATIELSTGD